MNETYTRNMSIYINPIFAYRLSTYPFITYTGACKTFKYTFLYSNVHFEKNFSVLILDAINFSKKI